MLVSENYKTLGLLMQVSDPSMKAFFKRDRNGEIDEIEVIKSSELLEQCTLTVNGFKGIDEKNVVPVVKELFRIFTTKLDQKNIASAFSRRFPQSPISSARQIRKAKSAPLLTMPREPSSVPFLYAETNI